MKIIQSGSVCTGGYVSAGVIHGCDHCGTEDQATCPSAPVEHTPEVVASGVAVKEDQDWYKKIFVVVEGPKKSIKWPPMGLYSNRAADNRRKCMGVGSPPWGTNRTGLMVQDGGQEILQLKRAKSNTSESSLLTVVLRKLARAGPVRHDSSFLPVKTEQNEEQST